MSDNKAGKGEREYTALPHYGIPKLLPFLRGYKRQMGVMVFLGLVTTVGEVGFPLFDRYALDNFVGRHTIRGLGLFILIYTLVLGSKSFLDYVTVYLCSKVELYVGRDLKNASFGHLQTLSFSYFNTNNVGYIHARVMSDTSRIGELVSWRLMDFIWNMAYIVFAFVTMMFINYRLGLLIMALVPIAAILIIYFQKKLIVLKRRIREINSRITANFNEGITGARQIKTLVVEDTIQKDFDDETARMRRVSIHSTHVSALFIATVTMMASVALALVLWRGGRLTARNLMLIGDLQVFMSYALGIMDPIQYVIETIAALIDAQANIERFTRLLETKSDVSDRPEVIARYGDSFEPKRDNFERLHGDIEFRDVSFHYPDGKETVLEHFNLKVPQGTNVAIVGETGAGKSTLVNLVCRFFEPTDGQVLIDGRDARDRSQLWLHSNIGYVLQTPHLFSGSVRDNLRYGKPDATDEEILRALELVSADRVVAKLGGAPGNQAPDTAAYRAALTKGLGEDVGEGGDLLSTGEKQLISFARAIITDPAILVLDEATSSIDTVTEKAIQEAIKTVIRGRTSFMIAHRLSTVVDCDVILVVHEGRIVESGRHDELMEKHGYYYRLYSRQYEEAATQEAL